MQKHLGFITFIEINCRKDINGIQMYQPMLKIGLILSYSSSFLKNFPTAQIIQIETPFGKPASPVYKVNEIDKEIFFLFRNGEQEGNLTNPANHKANLYALYQCECKTIISSSECQSLREEIIPGEFIVFDQFLSLDKQEEVSFHFQLEGTPLNNASLYKPFSDDIRNSLIEACIVNQITTHTRGIVYAVSGLRNTTRAESNLFRRLGGDVIEPNCVPEAILAHELNIRYGAVAVCTSYDSWRTDIPPATADEKLEIAASRENILHTVVLQSLRSILEE